jgi:mannose-6-phosphate isomerase-like protein (cupin superfamily)
VTSDDDSTALAPGTVIPMADSVIGLRADGTARLMASSEGGPPKRLEGHTIGFGAITPDNLPPHAGERHPDGDEVLIMVAGAIDVDLEFDDGTRTVRLGPGDALVVPQGVWHLIHCVEPGQLVNITPGPSGEYRPIE